MTRLAVLASFALAAGSAHAAPASNPAFLGIEMQGCVPVASPRAVGPCMGIAGVYVTGVTKDSAAADAGVLSGDVIVGMDGKHIANVEQLSTIITNHAAGDEVSVEIYRHGEHLTVTAHLVTRAEVLQRRFVDKPINLEVVDYDDGNELNLDTLKGDTRVLAWFNAEHCSGCAAVVRKLADAVDARKRNGTTPKLLAITWGEGKTLQALRLTTTLGMAVAIAGEAFFNTASINESDRAYFMIVDRNGIVRFVTPIASDADDTEAQIDDVLAAAEHCMRR